MFDASLYVASQKSIVPSKKEIKTIPYDASLQQINWNPSQLDDDYADKVDPPLTRLAKKKSSTFSVHDIKNTTQKKIENEDLFNKLPSQNLSQFNIGSLNNLYNLGDNNGDDAVDVNLDGLFKNTNGTKSAKPKPIRPSVQFGKTPSGFSNYSNSNDFGNGKSLQMQNDNSNLFKTLQNSLSYVKIPVGDMGRFDIDEKQYDNLPEIPNISSRGNSFQQLLKSDPTPALFRGGSSIIDPRMLKRNA